MNGCHKENKMTSLPRANLNWMEKIRLAVLSTTC